MMIKQNTNIEIYAHELACLLILNKPMGDQNYTYNLVVCLSNIPFLFFDHFLSNLKLFDDLCRWVFDPGGRPPKSLIIRDWLFPGSKSHFSRISIFYLFYFRFMSLIYICFWAQDLSKFGSNSLQTGENDKESSSEMNLRINSL